MPPLSRRAIRNRPWVCRTCRNLSASAEKQFPERKAWQKLPMTPARTRFAPSPTGFLHLGSLRTALFNYLLARATRGQFVLRVEDTDKKKRTVAGAEKRLYDDLKWAGLDWDEGPDKGGRYGPYKQSERTDLYTDHAQRLLKSGHAYRCFCTSERLNELAKQRNQLGQSSDYDRTCAGMSKEESDERASKGEAYVIRLKAPASPPDYFDLVYGTVGKLKSKTAPKHRGEPTYDDCILIKSDGLPTYHLANVVDDHYMEITHVIRASEWMTSTPKHLVMYKAFGWEPPKFAHVGLLQDGERQKFSKRNADLDLRTLKNDGILPEALINYVVLHGWSHNLGNDFISLQELVQNFDLKFTKGNTIVQPTKLNYLQQRYASKHISEGGMTYESIVDRVYAVAKEKLQLKGKNQDLRNRIAEFMKTVPESYTTAREFYERHIALFEPIERPKYVPSKASNDPNLLWDTTSISLLNQEVLDQLELGNLSWNPKEIRQKIVNNSISFTGIKRIIRDFDEKTPNMSPEEHMNHFIEGPDGGDSEWKRSFSNAALHYLRWAIVGGKSGPGVADCMVLLGRDETALRIEEAARILNLPELQESPSDEEAMRIAGFLELEGPPSDKQ